MMPVVIRIDGKRIIATIPYAGGQGSAMARKVPGFKARWDKKVTPNKFLGWTYPLTLESCYALRRVFGEELEIDDGLADWARGEIARSYDLEDIREDAIDRFEFTRLPIEAPQLYLAMMSRKYQMAGVAFAVTAGQSLLGDEPGLGKTLQALGAIIESGARKILVACPKTATRSVWEREVRRWAPGIIPYVAQGTRTEREDAMRLFAFRVNRHEDDGPQDRHMLIVNTEMIRAKRFKVCQEGLPIDFCNSRPPEARGDHRHVFKQSQEWPFLHEQIWDAIILDESHNSLASTANRNSKRITQARLGAVSLRKRLRPGGLAIAISGTPFKSKLDKSWGTLNWLRPDKFGSFWQFAEQQFGVTSNGFAKVVGRNEDGRQVVEPLDQEAFDRALRPYYLARKKSEVAPDLPPIIYAGTPPDEDPDGPCYVRLDMDPKQAKAYHQMEEDAQAAIKGGLILANGVLAEITRQRQLANSFARWVHSGKMVPELPSNKIDWIRDFMLEREGSDGKVIIASSFTEMVELTATILRKDGWEVLTLTGATKDRDRALLQGRFNNMDDPLRVVVLNTKAGGEAITLDAADDMVTIDIPWTSDEFTQLENRAHRVSRMHQLTIYRLISNDTIESWIASLTEEQRKILETASPRKLSEMMKGRLK
jgi:SNF2 family DNA or RNA helicase